jgi:CRISPR type IV-associated protein Csf3
MAYSDVFEPLRVTARLRTGIISDQWLPLDAILLYQASRDAYGPQIATSPGGEPEKQGIGMPLAIVHPGEPYWYYACSWAQPQPWWAAEGRDHWNKRFDQGFAHLVDFGGRRGKVIIEQGRYKAYHMPIFYRVADKMEWYCVGDRKRIEALLSTVTHVGKKRVQGWGRVIRWKVESWPKDWSVWRDGRLTRGVPAEDVAGKGMFDFVHYGLRPSYYRWENQMLLAMPS